MAKVIEISPISALGADDEEPLRVAAYCRVSTDHEEQSSSLEMQERYYTRLIEQTPNWINAGIFSEKVSGLEVKKRQEFRKLLRSCRKGKIDLILTKSVSRFGRNTLDSLRALQELQVLGVDVYFEAEKLWLHDRQMQVLMTAYVAFAQAESEGASQSIRWGAASIPCGQDKGIPRAAAVLGIFSRLKPFLALFLAFGNAGFLPLQQALCAWHMGAETAGRAWGGLHPVRRGAGPGRKGSRGHTPVQG